MKLRGTFLAMAGLAVLGLGLQSASAATVITYGVSGPGNVGNGPQPIDATAVFTLTSGHLNLALTNNLNDPVSVGSVIVGISFSITGGGAGSTPAVTGRSGTLIDINTTTNVPFAYPLNATTELAFWDITSSPGPDVLKLTNGNDPGIIGFGAGGTASSPYTAGNGSLGTSHQPLIQHTGTFDMDISGLALTSGVTNVQFLFNTNFTPFTGTPQTGSNPVPLPAAVWSGGALIVGLAAVRRMKRKSVV